jgi:hypothetical protein
MPLLKKGYAADEDAAMSAQEIGYLFQGAPRQRRPCFLLAQQEDNRVGRVAATVNWPRPDGVSRTSPGVTAARTALSTLPATLRSWPSGWPVSMHVGPAAAGVRL